MKLKDGIIISEVRGEKVLVDAGVSGEVFRGIIKLNETGGVIAEKLLSGATEDELVEHLTKEYDVDDVTARNDIESFVKSLGNAGIME